MKVPIVAALLLTFGLGYCLVQGYKVEPRTAAESGWTQGEDGYVSEIVTCCWDELDSTTGAYVELFVGSRGSSPGGYVLNVYEVDGGVDPVATSPETTAVRDHAWLRFPLGVATGYEFTKGKTYEIRFTRSGSDSIQYYWDGDPDNPMDNGPYKYGDIVLPPGGGFQPEPTTTDLYMRCYGLL